MARKSRAAPASPPVEQPDINVVMRPISILGIDDTNARHTAWQRAPTPTLMASIRANGILQPLLVRASADGGFSVVDGSRRLKAATMLGIPLVPTVEAPPGQDHLTSLAMNVSFETMTPFEKYRAYGEAIAAGADDKAIKAQLGFDDANIKVMRALGSMSKPLLARLEADNVPVQSVLTLARVPAECRDNILPNTGALTEWDVNEAVRRFFQHAQPLSPRQAKAITPTYLKLGGRMAQSLFPDALGETDNALFDAHLIEQAKQEYLEAVAAERRAKSAAAIVVLPAGYTVTGWAQENGKEWARHDLTAEQRAAAAVAAGFASYADFNETCDRLDDEGLDDQKRQTLETKVTAYDAEIERVCATPDTTFVARFNYNGDVVFEGPLVDRAATGSIPDNQVGSATAGHDTATDGDAGDTSDAVGRRARLMHGAMLREHMLQDNEFGLRMTAAMLYYAAARQHVSELRDLVHVSDNTLGAAEIKDMAVNHDGREAFGKSVAGRLTFLDFASMDPVECARIIALSMSVLMNGSVSDGNFAEIVGAFGLDVRALWNAAVPTTEHAVAWLKQFKLVTLRKFATKLDPQLSGLARIVAASKKADAVEVLAKALVHKGPGQPAPVVVNARSMLPPGLAVAQPAADTAATAPAVDLDHDDDPRERAGWDEPADDIETE